ncbi:aconitate hydratase AcnA [Tabrizicola sp.]|uniref:aconitate hydratase AcnA n=1 Tax=Tabrizicola sp. TaxID=2005166 RepID=UPI001A39CD13|nr:aconitate hydratase AcnA [Tabrizicola sp.]MBL9073260.1 aconitate hydratase AcnA [Tabrizicola sp.]
MTVTVGQDLSGTRKTLTAGGQMVSYYSIPAAEAAGLGEFAKLPASLKVVLENMLRFEDGKTVTVDDIKAFSTWGKQGGQNPIEIAYRPARVLMQDFTGVPAVVDLAAMRDGIKGLGGNAQKINPLSPVDLVIDHSVMIDEFGHPRAFQMNVDREYQRNMERYVFLKWGQKAFNNFRVVPPGTGICHQVNLEYLAQTVWTDVDQNGQTVAYPDTLVGTDSHTTMVNGLAVLGWGVGGIEAEAAMLGQPVSMLIPEVVGFKLTGKMVEGTTATDLVLKVVQMLRKHGVVNKFVEFYGEGLDHLPLADRATIANMAPEYGATCGFFPIDGETIRYLRNTGREESRIELVEAYAKANGMWRGPDYDPVYTSTLLLDMGTIVPAISGPKRPQDYLPLGDAASGFYKTVADYRGVDVSADAREMQGEGGGVVVAPRDCRKTARVDGQDYVLRDGSVVIAAITSCTNTSNPYVMVGAGLVARKARALGLTRKPWVKTSLAPGSQVVGEYLAAAGLQEDLDAVGFNLVGYGCTTCIGNSGPLQPEISKAINEGDLMAAAVLSGNRNFEGRISPDVRANYLASPPLVVAYALAGDMNIDLTTEPLGMGTSGPVYLKDIWPTNKEVADIVHSVVTREAFQTKYADVFKGDAKWQGVQVTEAETYDWPPTSTYIQNPPYFQGMSKTPGVIKNVTGARILALLGDMITTDHISPAGSFKASTPAGKYLTERQVPVSEFNSYGARRGNHEVMMRGTFANIRIRNEMLDGVEGGYTLGPDGKQTSIFDASMEYQAQGTPLVIFGGIEYGAGSSRDWAAKGTALLGVKAVIAESFERIHRSNLVGMGVIPFEFLPGENRKTLGLKGDEVVSIGGLEGGLKPLSQVPCTIRYADGTEKVIQLKCRIDTAIEIEYVENGGVLHYVLRNLAAS